MTVFQKAVWEATKKIPRGKVTTYAVIASLIGRPRAARAVGNALNKNPFAPKVPCHRVVKSDGSLGGFAGGTRKKKQMLEKEGVRIKKNKNKIVDFEKILK
jgi:methylated-DNA-[protein]-cysteine S-methyltransferase